VREIIKHISQEIFNGNAPMIIGTGGFAQLYEQSDIFDAIIPELVLQGLRIVYEKNH
jgi:type III pantothenate kinase